MTPRDPSTEPLTLYKEDGDSDPDVILPLLTGRRTDLDLAQDFSAILSIPQSPTPPSPAPCTRWTNPFGEIPCPIPSEPLQEQFPLSEGLDIPPFLQNKERLMDEPAELKAGLPEDFSGRNEDATWWLFAMKAYLTINQEVYSDEKTRLLVMLNKMSKGWGTTFTEGWYLKLLDEETPLEEKTLERMYKDFIQAFIPKDLADRAHQKLYSLTMYQFCGDSDQFTTAFYLAQVCSGIKANNILIDTLQWGVTN